MRLAAEPHLQSPTPESSVPAKLLNAQSRGGGIPGRAWPQQTAPGTKGPARGGEEPEGRWPFLKVPTVFLDIVLRGISGNERGTRREEKKQPYGRPSRTMTARGEGLGEDLQGSYWQEY